MRFSLLTLFAFVSFFSYSQKLYKPRDVQKAFDKGTRSPDGKPGAKYWQNKARYMINVTAMPPDRTIKGSEQISYINNSPDTLRVVFIKLFLNIHKPGAPRNGGALPDYLTSGVQIDQFAVNGEARPWRQSPYTYTSVGVRLPKALAPHDSLQLSFDWHYEISLQSKP
jgi:hypothetical protein